MGKPLSAQESKGLVRDVAERVRFRLVMSSAAHRLRSMSNSRRMLPAYLIVGTQKGGTTFLHSILSQHPQVRDPLKKEINYFSFQHFRGEPWYRAHFPLRAAGLVTGEATTNYMFHPGAAERIASLLPDAKIIVCLRDPAGRALSHWQMNMLNKHDSVPFAEAIEREDERTAGEIERIAADPTYQAWPFRRFSYRRRGLYLDQILRLERCFPKEQILVIDSGDLFRRTDETLARAESFLGLRGWKPAAYRAENVAKRKEPVHEESVEALRSFYRPHDEALFEHLGWSPRW
ncbi:MAG TPA: sulfotransferase [Fimbriimonas sp.]